MACFFWPREMSQLIKDQTASNATFTAIYPSQFWVVLVPLVSVH